MYFDQVKKDYMKRMVFRAVRLPVIYLIVGISLVTLSYLNTISWINNIYPESVDKNIFSYTDKIGMLFIAFAGLRFIYSLVVFSFQHFEKKLRENHHVASMIFRSIRKSLRIVYILIAINIILVLAGPNKYYMVLANDAINIIIIASIGWIAIQILYTFDAVVQQQMANLNKENYKRAKSLYTKTHIIRNILTVLIVIITLAAILMKFGSVRNLGISLLASAGMVTAMVGLASQKALGSLFHGLQIAISQPIQIGDVVVIENQTGIIEEITFTFVVMRIADRRRMILPISHFIDRSFINWSHDTGMRGSITLNVDYLMPIQPLRDHLNKILATSKNWDGQVCKLIVNNITDRSVELNIAISASNEDNLFDLRAEVREHILEFIREKYPQYFPSLGISRAYDLNLTDEKQPGYAST